MTTSYVRCDECGRGPAEDGEGGILCAEHRAAYLATTDYRVWVHIERRTHRDTPREDFEDVGLPDPLATFSGEAEAREYVRALLLVAGVSDDVLATSDNR